MLTRVFLALALSLLVGCAANTTTSKYDFTASDGTKGSIEIPKDIQAEGLDITTSTGARIKVRKLRAVGNVEQTKADSERIKSKGDVAGKIFEGAAEGAVKGAKGF